MSFKTKILYIEDQLTINITTIKRLFSGIFSDDRTLRLLDEIENSEDITSEKIIDACSYTSCLDICHTFLNALAMIVNHFQDYELVIIDRNLRENSYHKDIEDIKSYLKQCGFDDPDQKIDTYKTREGDLLLLVLLKLDKKFKDKIYYLTANLDEIRGSQMLSTLIDVNDFYENHIIEKNPEKEIFLSSIISRLPSFTIENEYKQQCDIIRRRFGQDYVDMFIALVLCYKKDDREQFINKLRDDMFSSKLLISIAQKMNDREARYWTSKNMLQLRLKTFIKGQYWNDEKKVSEFCGLPFYNKKIKNIGYNSIIQNACLAIAEICSDVIHKDFTIDDLTHHTMSSLLHQYCDVILWYDKVMDSFKR